MQKTSQYRYALVLLDMIDILVFCGFGARKEAFILYYIFLCDDLCIDMRNVSVQSNVPANFSQCALLFYSYDDKMSLLSLVLVAVLECLRPPMENYILL